MTNFIPETPSTILVAMSGGVDSAVAAARLHDQGFDVIGARRGQRFFEILLGHCRGWQ